MLGESELNSDDNGCVKVVLASNSTPDPQALIRYNMRTVQQDSEMRAETLLRHPLVQSQDYDIRQEP